jgi:hypothetical protein
MSNPSVSSFHQTLKSIRPREITPPPLWQLLPCSNAKGDPLTLKQACSRENPGSAMCVQSLDDSRDIAIRITYRISLRSSSLWEPRHPSLKVVTPISVLVRLFRPTLNKPQRALLRARLRFSFFHGVVLVAFQRELKSILEGGGFGENKQCATTRKGQEQSSMKLELHSLPNRRSGKQALHFSPLRGKLSRSWIGVIMILPQVHLRKPCYDFTFL